MNYYKKDKNRLVCLLCQYYCKLKNSQTGVCGVNQNIGSQIKNLVYGYPSAINIDPIEKKPLYHFLPSSKSFSLGTVGCNFHCSFCQNWQISQEHNIDKSKYFEPRLIASLAQENACQSISYTYNEPTIFYPYAKDIALEAKKLSLKNIFVSNGYESKEVIDDMVGVIDAINIDLKSFDEKYYKHNLGGNLKKNLENLKHFRKNNLWIEITTLIVPTQNDSEEELLKIASFIANELGTFTPWHISAFHADYKELNLPSTSLQSLSRAYEIGKSVGLEYVYVGNVQYENNTKCTSCGTSLIERKYFQVTKNNLINESCPKCNKKLEGVFDKK
ncbi:MAG: AmmeMemoRadiSam system radical SAM enzyme [Arcobacter sp.]|uniref:AmmeMemoRadiSam system radical SAM enzyme n=1 Tax=Arcobacter sp. TaxID=1872629 RepID=UPI003B007076